MTRGSASWRALRSFVGTSICIMPGWAFAHLAEPLGVLLVAGVAAYWFISPVAAR